MKVIARILPILATTASLCIGCEQMEDAPDGGLISVATQVESFSRSGHTTARLDQFRLFVVNTRSVEYTYVNMLMRRVEGEFTSCDDKLNPVQMRWQNRETPVRIMATTYDKATTDQEVVALSIDTDQRRSEVFDRADILYYAADRIVPATNLVNGKLPLPFSHICARFRLEIIFAEVVASEKNPITEVSIDGIKTAGGFNFATGAWAHVSGDAALIRPFEEGYSPELRTAVYDAMLVPQQTAAQGVQVRFKTKNKSYDYLVLPQVDFTRNTTHTLTLHVTD